MKDQAHQAGATLTQIKPPSKESPLLRAIAEYLQARKDTMEPRTGPQKDDL